MSNHPNRTWRRRLQAAADAELQRVQWRDEPGVLVMTQDQLRERLRQWYTMGAEWRNADFHAAKERT